MKRIKILHVIHDFLNGGIESLVYYLTQVQKNNPNIEVAILCCQSKGKVTNYRIVNTKIPCHFVEIKPWDLKLSHYVQAVKIANNYDILHLHSFKPLLAYSLYLSNSKLLYTNHSAGKEGRDNTLTIRVKTSLLKFFLNHCVHFITHNSHYTKNFWQEKRGITRENNLVVYNGVYFNDKRKKSITRNELSQTENTFIVGTSSRFIKWKRVEKLIMAFSFFLKKKGDALLLLVGDGPEKDSLMKLTEELGILDKVIFTGHKTNVTDYQEIMDVCVFPSNCEPFGLVAIECMCLGKPVVVFRDGGGITEIVESVEPENIVDDIDDLSNKLLWFYLNKYKERDSIKIDRRIEFAKSFDIKITEQNFYNVYKTIIS